jgi:hypothetical protein
MLGKLVQQNLVLGIATICIWLALKALEVHWHASGSLDPLYLLTLLASSMGFWLINRPLARLVNNEELGVLLTAVVAALLTVLVLIGGVTITRLLLQAS